ncbi:centromere protein L [Pholidichthys leucotaenia]
MERIRNSAVRSLSNSAVAQRSCRSKTYRQSYRSCLGGASRLGHSSPLTARRLNTSRRAFLHNITEKVNPEHLALLVKTEWQLSYVTPLYHFRYTQLKSYSRHLSAFIAAEKQQGFAVEVEGQLNSCKVSLFVVNGIAGTDNDPETVLIQIHSKPPFSRKDEPQKLIWSGWLACTNGNAEYLNSLPKDFTCLPLFGSRGAENLTSLIKYWFQQTFDCCFGPLEISQTSLQWLVALWTNCHTESHIQHLKMVWTLPVVPPLEITYIVNPQDAWELWCSVRNASLERSDRDEETGNIDIEEVMRLMQSLKSHFYRHFRLDLSAGTLSQVSTALGSVRFSGKIKIINSSYMITTLTLLTECALLKMPM